jgi:hypothetical protein
MKNYQLSDVYGSRLFFGPTLPAFYDSSAKASHHIASGADVAIICCELSINRVEEQMINVKNSFIFRAGRAVDVGLEHSAGNGRARE